MNMKCLLLLGTIGSILITSQSEAQSRMIYGGANFSNVQTLETKPGRDFGMGYQVGFYRGGKTRNFLKREKLFTSGFALEYNKINVVEKLWESDQIELSSYHSIRASLPFRIRLSSARSHAVKLQFNLEPGINYFAVKTVDKLVVPQHGFSGVDLFTNAGLTLNLGRLKSDYEKSGYKFSGLVLSANRYMSTNPFRRMFNSSISLDQFQFNAGIEFSYVKVMKKKRFKLFG